MSPGNHRGLHPQIREEAAEWFVSFCEEEVDPGACKEFNAWLRRSPEHVRAYLRISAFWEDAEDLRNHTRHGIAELVQRAATESNVVALDDAPERPNPIARGNRMKLRHIALAAGLAAVCALGGLVMWRTLYGTPVYSTVAGEQRTIMLSDGSTVELNARSRLRVHYTQMRREVALLEGQALFKVARSPSRPFVVLSDGTNIRAVGTQFDVYRKRDGTVVTVVEGQVAVSSAEAGESPRLPVPIQQGDAGSARDPLLAGDPARDPMFPRGPVAGRPHSPPAAILVTAGQRVIARPHSLGAPQSTDPAAATAWTEGKLVFDAVPLKEVLEEFNRYLPRPLLLDDPQLVDVHISGVFTVTESQQFLEFLQQRFGIVSHETGTGVRIARP